MTDAGQARQQGAPSLAERLLFLAQEHGVGRATLEPNLATGGGDGAHYPATHTMATGKQIGRPEPWPINTSVKVRRTTRPRRRGRRGGGWLGFGLLVPSGDLGLELLQFLFHFGAIVSVGAVQGGQRRLGAGQPFFKVLHVGVQRAPRRQRLVHFAATRYDSRSMSVNRPSARFVTMKNRPAMPRNNSTDRYQLGENVAFTCLLFTYFFLQRKTRFPPSMACLYPGACSNKFERKNRPKLA